MKSSENPWDTMKTASELGKIKPRKEAWSMLQQQLSDHTPIKRSYLRVVLFYSAVAASLALAVMSAIWVFQPASHKDSFVEVQLLEQTTTPTFAYANSQMNQAYAAQKEFNEGNVGKKLVVKVPSK